MTELPATELSVTVEDGSRSLRAGGPVSETGPVRGWLVLEEPGGPRVELPQRAAPAITVGRDPSCTVRVPFDDGHVSRRHAQLSWLSPGWWEVTDLCSSNGTLVSGERVHDPVPITAGQFLQVGRTVYRIEFDQVGPVDLELDERASVEAEPR
jgi:pSer/pThr/pTyr-binding forkhead associated (FHA) protein